MNEEDYEIDEDLVKQFDLIFSDSHKERSFFVLGKRSRKN